MPEMRSSQSSAPAMPHLPRYTFVDASGSCDLLRNAQLCATRARICALFVVRGLHRFRRHQFEVVIGVAPWCRPFRLVEPFPAVITEKILYDTILQRVKTDHGDTAAGRQARD